MTINVAVKCPDGLALCADSLVTISEGGSPISIVPFSGKLFSIGEYAAGAMLNGAGSIAGRTIEDFVLQFGQNRPFPVDDYGLRQLAEDLGNFIQTHIPSGADPMLEVIVAGFSRGTAAEGRRYGEIYSLFWDQAPFRLRELYNTDSEFGTHAGGQPQALDRFLYGVDDWILIDMFQRRQDLYQQAHEHILAELANQGINIPADTNVPMPATLADFDVVRLVSDYSFGATARETMENMKDGMFQKLETMERFFSIQVAVDYCVFLASCAYAANNFTFKIPEVGSEMRVATVTRECGFDFKRIWKVRPSDNRTP